MNFSINYFKIIRYGISTLSQNIHYWQDWWYKPLEMQLFWDFNLIEHLNSVTSTWIWKIVLMTTMFSGRHHHYIQISSVIVLSAITWWLQPIRNQWFDAQRRSHLMTCFCTQLRKREVGLYFHSMVLIASVWKIFWICHSVFHQTIKCRHIDCALKIYSQ